LSWRSFVDRDTYIENLRPFITSQRVYDQILTKLSPEVDINTPFLALCENILGAERVYLSALGPLAPLVEGPLQYPIDEVIDISSLHGLVDHWDSSDLICFPIPEKFSKEFSWAIPLWSERGLIGLMLIGPKLEGGLYTQEEIEIARTVGERLVDIQASAEMARRLMSLQRQRMVESRVIDQRTRRVLHDEVLPKLHAVLLEANLDELKSSKTLADLGGIHAQISDLLKEIPPTTTPEIKRYGFVGALREMVSDEFENVFDNVTWQLNLSNHQDFDDMTEISAEVIFYAAREVIRNAAQHGRVKNRPLNLEIFISSESGFEVSIKDNGSGVNEINQPIKASGHGLALHSTMMAVIGGNLIIESVPKEFTRVTLTLPKD
jgi:signal transduction histidine kinase